MFKLFLFSTLIVGALAQTQTQNGWTVTITDKSGGQLPSSTITNQINLFFQLYPGLAQPYGYAPKSVTLILDPAKGQGGVGASPTSVTLSVASLKANANDGNYLTFGLNFMLSAFYTKGPTTTAKPTTPSTGYSGMTDAARQAALTAHNNYRSQLAQGLVQSAGGTIAKASNMNVLKYDKWLEAEAGKWADTCPGMVHYTNGYGQNLYGSSGTQNLTYALQQAAQLWWNEVTLYKSSDNVLTDALWHSADPKAIGHFTQMAWAKTTKVGCAVKTCASPKTFVVCNYDTGNVMTQKIWESGNTCSACSSGCTNSLCNVA